MVDRRATYARWFFDRQELYQAWSNVDFNYLLGFSRFRKGDREFTSMLFLSNLKSVIRAGLSQEVDDFLATLPADGHGFLPVEGDFANAEALEGIEALHDLYVAEEARLKDAYELRQQAKGRRRYLPNRRRRTSPCIFGKCNRQGGGMQYMRNSVFTTVLLLVPVVLFAQQGDMWASRIRAATLISRDTSVGYNYQLDVGMDFTTWSIRVL